MSSISILGCGWLGLPLAQALVQEGFSVKGSTTSANKVGLLESQGIAPYVLALEADGVSGKIGDFLAGVDVLVIDIPPRFHFSLKIAGLIPIIAESGVQKVLLVSSISVYDTQTGQITEEHIPDPQTEKARQLFEAEKALQNQPDFQTTVVRFGGLIGGQRHPVKYLAGGDALSNPDAPINLIHQTDCIGIIQAIIQQDAWGETFNAVAPHHPTRERYYTATASGFGLPLPRFDHSKPSEGKTVDPTKLIRALSYRFRFPEL